MSSRGRPSSAASRHDDGRMVTGEPKVVAERLLEMKAQAQADEIVVVTPEPGPGAPPGQLRGGGRRLAARQLR